MKDKLIKQAYSYKLAGPTKEDEKKLSTEDVKLIKNLLNMRIHGVSFLSPKKCVDRFNKNSRINAFYKVFDAVKCTITLGDGDYKGSNVFTYVDDVKLFKDHDKIVAIASNKHDEHGQKCLRVSFLKEPIRFTFGSENCLNKKHDYDELAHVDIYNEEQWNYLLENFKIVKNNAINTNKQNEELTL